MRGRIVRGLGGLYDICCEDGTAVACRARGSFRRAGLTPTVGDYVQIGADGSIDSIEERRNLLIRPPIANLDVLFVCVPCARPAPVLTTVDKLISIAEHQGIEPVIIVTKTDEDESASQRLCSIYRTCGFTVFPVSSPNGYGIGDVADFFKQKLPGRTSAFAGASGVGKSTLMNALFPSLGLATGDISEKIERGKHTTRHVQLYDLSELARGMSGALADTPGFSMLDFVNYDFYGRADLPFAFREFKPLLGGCRYTDCTHTKEDNCAILNALDNNIIPRSRYESFLEIYSAIKDKKTW